MKYTKLISVFIIILTFAGCTLKGYYFPLVELIESKTYKYECKEEPSKTEYWKLTSNMMDNTLTTEAFNSEYIQYMFFKEQLTKEGSELLEFISYSTENNGQKKNIVINKPVGLDVHKWERDKPYSYSTEVVDKYCEKVTFERRREFIGKVNIYILSNNINALKFKETYKTEDSKTQQVYEYSQFSYYGKGLGLVKMEKEYADGTKEVLELTDVISNSDWKKMVVANN